MWSCHNITAVRVVPRAKMLCFDASPLLHGLFDFHQMATTGQKKWRLVVVEDFHGIPIRPGNGLSLRPHWLPESCNLAKCVASLRRLLQ